MIGADRFLAEAGRRGFGIWAGVPCSYLSPFINRVIDSDLARYVGAANEGDAVAIAAGAELAGTRGVAMFQNSGLGNAVNPLTSLTDTFRIPVLLITTLRGDPAGPADEPQHERMGRITGDLLERMGIPWEFFPTDESAIAPALDRADAHMRETGRPYALVMRKGTAEPYELRRMEEPGVHVPPAPRGLHGGTPEPVVKKRAMLEAIGASVDPADVLIATTGYTGRELYATGDAPNRFYMVGSMGCAVSLGLGIALVKPERRVVVLDGDGAALMRLGALAVVGHERPDNLVHVVLDNGVHESTGGQATVSRSIDFRGIAAACGYPSVLAATTAEQLTRLLAEAPRELTFVHVPILPGIDRKPPRPTVGPVDVAARLREHLSR